jgi:hypothetical protein
MNFGSISVPDPEPGWLYLEAVVLIKCLDDEGSIRYREIKSTGLTPVEALGMASTYIDTLRHQIMKRAYGGE